MEKERIDYIRLSTKRTGDEVLIGIIEECLGEIEKHRRIPVSEGLPEDRLEVDFFVEHNNSRFSDKGYYSKVKDGIHSWFGKDGQYSTRVVTHWKPIFLPEQPKKGAEG